VLGEQADPLGPGELPGPQHIYQAAAHITVVDVVRQAPGGQPGGDGGEDLVDGDISGQRHHQPGLLAEGGDELGGQGGFADPAEPVDDYSGPVTA
jgi:hypothetical protein